MRKGKFSRILTLELEVNSSVVWSHLITISYYGSIGICNPDPLGVYEP